MCFVIFVPLVGKNGIENNTEDSRAGKTAELEVCAADCELNGVGLEAKTAYLTRITAAIRRLRDFVRSILFSTILRTPIAEIIP